jgi:hypothetical protein
MASAKNYLTNDTTIMNFNDQTGHSVGADYAVSKIYVDYKRSHSSVQAGFIIGINF